ncbi:MAG: hypothetical protein MUP21_02035 [Dehalococcoidia bacterium]|nr:hypothetical protein [Dehalococcoidia bacterium]
MAIYATPYDNGTIKSLMQRLSTQTQNLVREIASMQTVFAQIADADLKAIIALGEGLTIGVDDTAIDALFAQIRDWQFAMNNYASNYTGAGSLSDCSFHAAKRAVL